MQPCTPTASLTNADGGRQKGRSHSFPAWKLCISLQNSSFLISAAEGSSFCLEQPFSEDTNKVSKRLCTNLLYVYSKFLEMYELLWTAWKLVI